RVTAGERKTRLKTFLNEKLSYIADAPTVSDQAPAFTASRPKAFRPISMSPANASPQPAAERPSEGAVKPFLGRPFGSKPAVSKPTGAPKPPPAKPVAPFASSPNNAFRRPGPVAKPAPVEDVEDNLMLPKL